MGNIINFLEHRTGLVHADSGDGTDYTLCGVTAEKDITGRRYADFRDTEDEIVPCMSKTARKITCPKCAAIIRYCCSLGVSSLGKVSPDIGY